MNFLARNNMRKFKCSDAGEREKAIDILQASIFDDLRSSERARHLQQRFCGPKVALTFNFFVSVAIILLNKLILGKVGFNYPICLTFIHYIASWFLMGVMNAISLLPPSPSTKSTPFSSLVTLGMVKFLSNSLANVSLKYNSVGFYQMAKVAVTPTIVLAELLLWGKTVTIAKVSALAVVSVGVAVATVTDIQFHLFGACIAFTWILPSAFNKIMSSSLQQKDNWTSLALMWKTTPITLFFVVILMPWLDPPGVFAFNWNASNTLAILLSAVLGFLLQLSGTLALGATSATSHVLLGQFKTCVILLNGYLFLNSNPGVTSLFGAVTALGGMSVYMYLNMLDSDQRKTSESGGRIPFPLPKSKSTEESSEARDGIIESF